MTPGTPSRLLRLLSACLALVAGCSRDSASPVVHGPLYEYVLYAPAPGSRTLEIEASFTDAPTEALIAPEGAGALRGVALLDSRGALRPIERHGDVWLVPECRTSCRLKYAIDLTVSQAGCRAPACPQRSGDATVGPLSAWLLRPEPAGDALVRLRPRGDTTRFATGLRRGRDGEYWLYARDLGEASYTAFGSLRRARLDVQNAALDVVMLGPPLAMGDHALLRWLGGAATCVANLFGRFPVDASLFVVPVRGADEVVFGRVLAMGGASIELLFGENAPPERAHDDWIVVHELLHLGMPSFLGEGHWLEEGMATYYEAILRERAGWTSEAELWTHFVQEMPRGIRKQGSPAAIEDRDDIDSTYWGGALFALIADVRIRVESQGLHSLDDVLRVALARQGDVTHAARVADFLRLGDEATGTHVLQTLAETFAGHGEPFDLPTLWRRLGVERSDASGGSGVQLHDDAPWAPWASVRRSISAGQGH